MKTLLLILAFAFSAFGQTAAATASATSAPEPLLLGNPSKAKTDLEKPDNYLVAHDGYTLSYNKSRGAANWVAWHLERGDIGDAERTNAFAPDTTLPKDWWILPTAYSGSGYDRGHLCPSKDRSGSEEINRATFLMSNMQPQTPKLNQKTWKYLEDYERELAKDNEEYIYAGCYGDKGKIGGKVTIPTNCWKIIVVLPVGENDLKRVDKTTRIIAVDMPNDETVSQRWRTYLTTVDAIEEKTGYDFLSEVPKKVQKVIESVKDGGSENGESGDANEPAAAAPTSKGKDKENKKTDDKKTDDKTPAKKTRSGDREYMTGARGGCYYLSESGKKVYVKDKSLCESAPLPKPAAMEPAPTAVPSTPAPPPAPAPTAVKPEPKAEEKTQAKPNADGRTYIKGARGGCYYLTESGKKVYVKDKSLCGEN